MSKLRPWLDAERFGFDWPEFQGGCQLQVTRTCQLTWKGRVYRYIEISTEKETIEIRIAPKGSMRVFRKRKELT